MSPARRAEKIDTFVPPALSDRVEEWTKAQPGNLKRPEAIRHLIERFYRGTCGLADDGWHHEDADADFP
jgi:hypothetical protein